MEHPFKNLVLLPEKALFNKNMLATDIMLNFLVVTLKKKKETGENNFNNIFYLIQYVQNTIISTCNQCKNY